MSTRAADRLAKMLARLNPGSPAFPGKPAPRKPTAADRGNPELAHAIKLDREHWPGALSPTRCGANQSQTRSVRLDGESPQDLAAALSAGYSGLTDPFTQSLVLMVAVPSWSIDPAVVMRQARAVFLPEIQRHKWRVDLERADKIIAGVMAELVTADACQHCSASGHVLGTDAATQRPAWQTCLHCGGLGRSAASHRSRAKRLGLRHQSFMGSSTQQAYEWLSRYCESVLASAAHEIARARHGDESDR